jgi:hypothetical protein
MPSSCGYTWSDSLDTLIRQEAQAAGVPLDLAYAMIAVESGFDPAAHVDNAFEDSVGLLQLNRRGGQGAGFSVATLQDPLTNLRLGLPHIAAAFAAVWSPTIDPYEYIYQVATRSGHPGPVPRDDPRIRRLAEVWSCFYPAAGTLYMGSLSPESAGPGPAQSLVGVPLALAALPLSLIATVVVVGEELLAEVDIALAAKKALRPYRIEAFSDQLSPSKVLARILREQDPEALNILRPLERFFFHRRPRHHRKSPRPRP